MSHTMLYGGAMALLLATLSPGVPRAQPAPADTTAPARNANVWDGRHHEPAAGHVRAKERAAGIAPSQPRAAKANRELAVIGQRLTAKAQRDVATAPAPPRPPNPDGR